MSTTKKLAGITFPAYKTSQSTKKAKKNLSTAGSTQRKQVIASLQNAAKKSTTPYENDIQSSFDKGFYAGADMAQADTTAYAQGLTAGYGDTYINPTISQSFNEYRGTRDNYIPQLATAAQSAYYGDKSANYNLANALQGEEADRFNRANAILQSRSNNDNMKYELGNTAAQTKFDKYSKILSLEKAAKAKSGGSRRTRKTDTPSYSTSDLYKEVTSAMRQMGYKVEGRVLTEKEFKKKNGSTAGYSNYLLNIYNNTVKDFSIDNNRESRKKYKGQSPYTMTKSQLANLVKKSKTVGGNKK